MPVNAIIYLAIAVVVIAAVVAVVHVFLREAGITVHPIVRITLLAVLAIVAILVVAGLAGVGPFVFVRG